MSKRNCGLGLLASSSFVALLVGGGVPAAWAGAVCSTNPANPAGSAITCIDIENTSVGTVSNAGTITTTGHAAQTATGITINNSTIASGITNTGSITANGGNGILINNSTVSSGGISNGGTISAGINAIATHAAINISGSTFLGGISNSGTLSAVGLQGGDIAILIGTSGNFVSSFSGGITNSGTIINANQGIVVFASTFTGNISNSGTISGASPATEGIAVAARTFLGGVTNSNTISTNHGFDIQVVQVSTFSGAINNSGKISGQFSTTGIFANVDGAIAGGITNSGAISGGVINGIFLTSVTRIGSSSAGGGIVNSGTIRASRTGISVNAVQVLFGGITNSGTISAGANGIIVNGVGGLSGGISNSGNISAGANAIDIVAVTNFTGGVTNSGTISAGANGIIVGSAVSTFSGAISNSGTISAGNVGIALRSDGTFSGNVSNSGTIIAKTGISVGAGVTAAAGSAIVNSGTIVGTTAAIDTTLATTPVTIDQTGGLISGAIMLSANADVLNVSGGTINGTVTSLGTTSTLNQSGGLVVLSGTNTIGTATLTGGELEIGDVSHTSATLTLIGNPTLDVNGGTLAGHGTLVGDAVIGNGGTLMPGGSIGTLTINGNLTFNAGSSYLVSLTPTQTSLTNVTGTVTINGGNVVLSPQGFFKPQTNVQILTSTGTLTGTFNPMVHFANPDFILIDPTLSFDAHDVFLSDKGSAFILPAGAPLNAQNAINTINAFALGGGNLPAGFLNLANLSGNAFTTAANQLAGQSQGSFAPVGFEAGNTFLNILLNPYLDGRSGITNAGVPLAYAGNQPQAPAANAFNALALGPGAIFAPTTSIWATAYGGEGTIQGNATTGAASTNSQIYGLAAGLDYRLSPDTVVGFALGGGGTSWQLDQGLGSGHSGMFQAGLFGTSHFGPAYVSGAAAYSLQAVTTDRISPLDGSSLQGNFDGNMFSGRVESGYRIPTGNVAVTPYGALQTQVMVLPTYSEFALTGPGAAALTYAGRTFTDTRTELGLWLDSDALMNQGVKLFGRVAWAHDFIDEGNSTVFFQSLPGTSFLVNTTQPANDSALVTAGFDYKFAPGWSLVAKFDGEYSKTTAIFAGTGAIKYQW